MSGLVTSPAVYAQGANGQQTAGQQPSGAAQKNWKDRAEYDLYVKISQTQDPKARLDLLNQWQDKYPQTDYSAERDQFYVITLGALAQTDPASRQQAVQKAGDILKRDPKNFRAAYLIALWGPVVGGANPTPDMQTQVQTAAQAVIDDATDAFDPSKKPAQVSQADFDKAKSQSIGLAHNALAWVALSKKDSKTAEGEYKASLQANPDQGNISYQYGKVLQEDKSVPDDQKFPTVLFEYARAAQYTGTGQLPASAQPQILDYFKKVYAQFHGSTDGQDQLLAQAKTAALPPDGFTIGSAAAASQQEATQLQNRINSDPAFKIWYSIKQSLTGDQGAQFFDSNMKEVEVPGGAEGVKYFAGTVISVDPADKPTKIVVGVEDPTKPDATLELSQPLPAAAMDQVKAGQKIEFGGVADSYTKDPYMLTFKDPSINGVQLAAPARKATRRRR